MPEERERRPQIQDEEKHPGMYMYIVINLNGPVLDLFGVKCFKIKGQTG